MDRKKIFEIFGGFLAVMLVFTILSRAASGAAMAKVETVKTSTGTIDHRVAASGRAEAGKEIAVYTENGQRVKEICVQEGQIVEEGEVLFLIDLEELEEQIMVARQELEKLKLQKQDAQSAQSVERQNRQNAKNRAAEDYNEAVAQGNSAVTEAKAAWDRAEHELQQFLQSNQKPAKGSENHHTIVPEADENEAKKDNQKAGSEEILAQKWMKARNYQKKTKGIQSLRVPVRRISLWDKLEIRLLNGKPERQNWKRQRHRQRLYIRRRCLLGQTV